MKKPSFEDTFRKYFSQMEWYREFLRKMSGVREQRLSRKDKKEICEAFVVKIYTDSKVLERRLSRREKKEIFEAFVIKICAAWEVLIEELFVDCLHCDTSQYAKYTGTRVRKHLRRDECRQLIAGTRGYFDVKSVGDLKGEAKKFLVDQHNPFKQIPRDDVVKIDQFYVIRNYLAHYSMRSKQTLFRLYKKAPYNLTRFREPGYFLLEYDKITNQVRFLNYINAFFDAADQMAYFPGI